MIVADEGVVIGPHDRPVINEPLGETFAIGIVTTCVGCASALGPEPRTIRGRAVPVASAWPAGLALRERLLETAEPEVKLASTETMLGPTTRTYVPSA